MPRIDPVALIRLVESLSNVRQGADEGIKRIGKDNRLVAKGTGLVPENPEVVLPENFYQLPEAQQQAILARSAAGITEQTRGSEAGSLVPKQEEFIKPSPSIPREAAAGTASARNIEEIGTDHDWWLKEFPRAERARDISSSPYASKDIPVEDLHPDFVKAQEAQTGLPPEYLPWTKEGRYGKEPGSLAEVHRQGVRHTGTQIPGENRSSMSLFPDIPENVPVSHPVWNAATMEQVGESTRMTPNTRGIFAEILRREPGWESKSPLQRAMHVDAMDAANSYRQLSNIQRSRAAEKPVGVPIRGEEEFVTKESLKALQNPIKEEMEQFKGWFKEKHPELAATRTGRWQSTSPLASTGQEMQMMNLLDPQGFSSAFPNLSRYIQLLNATKPGIAGTDPSITRLGAKLQKTPKERKSPELIENERRQLADMDKRLGKSQTSTWPLKKDGTERAPWAEESTDSPEYPQSLQAQEDTLRTVFNELQMRNQGLPSREVAKGTQVSDDPLHQELFATPGRIKGAYTDPLAGRRPGTKGTQVDDLDPRWKKKRKDDKVPDHAKWPEKDYSKGDPFTRWPGKGAPTKRDKMLDKMREDEIKKVFSKPSDELDALLLPSARKQLDTDDVAKIDPEEKLQDLALVEDRSASLLSMTKEIDDQIKELYQAIKDIPKGQDKFVSRQPVNVGKGKEIKAVSPSETVNRKELIKQYKGLIAELEKKKKELGEAELFPERTPRTRESIDDMLTDVDEAIPYGSPFANLHRYQIYARDLAKSQSGEKHKKDALARAKAYQKSGADKPKTVSEEDELPTNIDEFSSSPSEKLRRHKAEPAVPGYGEGRQKPKGTHKTKTSTWVTPFDKAIQTYEHDPNIEKLMDAIMQQMQRQK